MAGTIVVDRIESDASYASNINVASQVTFSNTVNMTVASTFPAGTVGAPSITTTGDTNTGIFFPAADTIAFAEGGVEAMRINASGNVVMTGTLTTAAQGIAKASLPTGSVLQVVNATTIAAISTSSASFVTTGFSVSITPSSSSSKVLLFVNGGGAYNGDANRTILSTIYRGATNLGDATYGLERVYGVSATIAPHSMSVLDSPATTSSTTYTCYFRSPSAASVDFSAADRGTISFTAMEIAG